LSVSIHFMGQRLIRCPHCGRMGFCKRKKNQ
jgi:DNA-directed RNA polymerase subunit RPC12/RpoP